jgi:cob(I)alamin adenosyltransferase
MANRLTQIATRTGDNGTTGLGDNTASKNSLRAARHGRCGRAQLAHRPAAVRGPAEAVRELLTDIQHQLFNLGGELSIPGFELLKTRRCCSWTRRWRTTTPSCRA